MSKSIRWLHLSDFHVGKDQYAQRRLFSEIHEHVHRRVSEGFIPDFVFITGDLANKGLEQEYIEFFDSFLSPLANKLGENWNGKILSIPGNHDVDRTRFNHFAAADVLKSASHVFDPTSKGKREREQFSLRFGNYSAYEITHSPSRWLDSDQGAFSKIHNVRGSEIGVVGANTAWLSKGSHDRHNLTPGPHILNDALELVKGCDLTVVLGHHPMDWLADSEAAQIRTILAKHHAIYLHGHLHEHDSRYDDGGTGVYLAVRCGSAFQGRTEDSPKLVNGLIWGDASLDTGSLSLQPLHWSINHREWKLSSDAFPNSRRLEGEDWWSFPLPGTIQLSSVKSIPRKVEASKTKEQENKPARIPVRTGWELVDKDFLTLRSQPEASDQLLQFFDGRPPSWKLAISSSVPKRAIVEELRSRFQGLSDSKKPLIVNILGAGGEGKSTAFLQTLTRLVSEDGWVALWRFSDVQNIDIETIERFSKQYRKVLIGIDEAHSAASWLPILLSRMNRLAQRNVHFLLCSRTIDWRADARNLGSITRESDYQEVNLRGLVKEDANLIVQSWSQLGKDGLGKLDGTTTERAAEQLFKASQDLEAETDEGAFFGAMLRTRYGDSLKDKIRSILYRLRDIEAPGGSLLESYALIAAMHDQGLRFLSLPVLAEALECSPGEAQKRIINPLADEAIAAGGGRFVLCRHRAIAEAAVAVLNETNLYGEINESFAKLSRAAIVARTKGQYVPDLAKWDYYLPEHFLKNGSPMIALAASEAMQLADPTDIHLRVNLSKVYRGLGEPKRAVGLFRDLESELSRVAWGEWSVTERHVQNFVPSVVLGAISVCDIPASAPPTNASALRSLAGSTLCFADLYELYGDQNYLSAMFVCAQVGKKLNLLADDTGSKIITDRYEYAVGRGCEPIADTKLIKSYVAIVEAMVPLINFDELTKGRVSRAALSSYKGLSALMK